MESCRLLFAEDGVLALLAILGSVPDPRTRKAQRHALLDMLGIGKHPA